jgi:hypothetical protein
MLLLTSGDSSAHRHDRFFMQASKQIPFDDPRVLNGVRGLYILSNLIIVGIYVYVRAQIKKKRGMSPESSG